MKKAIVFTLVFVSIFNLSGCHMDTWNSEEYDPRGYYPKQEAIYNEETLKKILECFDNKDFDTLIEMMLGSNKRSSTIQILSTLKISHIKCF